MPAVDFTTIGFFAVIVGIVLIFLGISTQQKGKVEGGGVVFIGPIPIIGATSERSLYLVLAITVIFLLFLIVVNLLGR